ncbi:sensor domain-containing diguanylate cyclase [Roseomonas sp. 18066]|uniref:GGDEF domain-containing protein n=1 Tax=Roseomonas sp. 18066 TaxID=2681412 RepID=UPI0013582735|nr:sensor domain-containing diguanylate cyclase [Roseomonas sp. 18066]
MQDAARNPAAPPSPGSPTPPDDAVARRLEQRVGWLTAISMVVMVAILAGGAATLLQERQEAWHRAEREAGNLVVALERDIARNFHYLDLSLQGAAAAMVQPGLNAATPEVRHMALFDRAVTAQYLGSILVLDAAGQVRESSVPPRLPGLGFGDRDYFAAHRAEPDLGLYVSRPYRSRLRGGDASIALSRRLDRADGGFDGVVMGALRLAYFHDLFTRLDLGLNGAVSFFGTDGRLIVRHPWRESDFDRDLSRAPTVQYMVSRPAGSFVGTATTDGIHRLFFFRRVGDLPLVVSVSLATEQIYAAWWRRALIFGPLLALLCAAVAGLGLVFRREMLRRLAAERALAGLAQRLSTLAATDGLTGLANRRQFDEALAEAWRRAGAGPEPRPEMGPQAGPQAGPQVGAKEGRGLALLLVDVDCFKAYNDRYGHQEGDRILRAIAAAIGLTAKRQGDLAARYGGEEFAVLLPAAGPEMAASLAEALRSRVHALDLPHADAPAGRVTISIGVAALPPGVPAPGAAARLVAAADAALYAAKRDGRDRVALAGALQAA